MYKLSGSLGVFADDTRLTGSVRTVEDAEKIQTDLVSLQTWADSNNMMFNQDKFENLRIGPNDMVKCDYNYLSPDMIDVILESATVRDLGIIMMSTGDFQEHISMVVKKVKRRCGWINRAFLTNNVEFRRFLWRNYIQTMALSSGVQNSRLLSHLWNLSRECTLSV